LGIQVGQIAYAACSRLVDEQFLGNRDSLMHPDDCLPAGCKR